MEFDLGTYSMIVNLVEINNGYLGLLNLDEATSRLQITLEVTELYDSKIAV